MPDSRLPSRVADLEKTTARIERRINHLETLISKPKEHHEDSIPPQQATAHESDSAGGTPAPVSKAVLSPLSAQQAEKPGYKTLKGWKTLFEFLAMVFAIGYAIVTYFQWYDLRHNFKIDQRAWIDFRLKSPTNGRMDLPPVGQEWSIPLQISNTGKTYARDVHVQVRDSLSPINKRTDFNVSGFVLEFGYGFLLPSTPPEIVSIAPTYWAPDGKTQIQIFVDPTIRKQIDEGSKYLDVFGWITYQDIFKKEHSSQFCFFIGSDTAHMSKAAEDCVNFNKIDDEIE